MAKLLNTASFVTQSAPATPSAGYGTLYASGSSLFFKNSSGIDYNLSIIGSSSFTVYTSSGTYTYNTGSGIQYIRVVCAGAGGGGASGRLGNVNAARTGGGGGAGGNINVAYFSSASLTTGSYTITVGGFGSGGGQRVGASTLNGISGGTGASSSFASGSTILVAAAGGPGGAAGQLGAGGGGGTNVAPTTATVPNPYPPFYYSGVNGTAGPVSVGGSPNATAAGNAFSGTRFLAGGGGAGGINNTNVSGSGGSGSAVYQYTTLIQSGSPGSPSGSFNGDNGANIFDIANFVLYYSGSNINTGVLIGTGGNGGAGGNPSGRGGSGSRAAGGGGGGASTINFTASAGGPGGDGFVIIFEYY